MVTGDVSHCTILYFYKPDFASLSHNFVVGFNSNTNTLCGGNVQLSFVLALTVAFATWGTMTLGAASVFATSARPLTGVRLVTCALLCTRKPETAMVDVILSVPVLATLRMTVFVFALSVADQKSGAVVLADCLGVEERTSVPTLFPKI